MMFLNNKRILLGITGGIAAYKSADVVRRLREVGAEVRVVMTEHAKQFITPLTLQAVSGHPVYDDLFDLEAEAAMGHIELARWAEGVLIAPATADFMARLIHGQANDLLTTLCLATRAPIAIAPAMNQVMWHAPQTQENLQKLKQKHIYIFGPAEGSQACGDVGLGRMLEPLAIVNQLSHLFSSTLLGGTKVLITAGPTHEAIDPVRYIANISSGKMGYALANAAQEAGAMVTLISGPVSLEKPPYMETISVISAREMYETVMEVVSSYDIFISAAAVADYHCQTISKQKIHKLTSTFTLHLTRNPDIVGSVAACEPKPFVVGFAAETENLKEQAQLKYQQKKMDMMIANYVNEGLGMRVDNNEVIVLGKELEMSLPLMHKSQLARELIPIIAKQYRKNHEK